MIRVQGLAKRYQLGEGVPIYDTLRDSIASAALAPFRRLRGGSAAAGRTRILWALDGVSFEVARGETIGVIGRNGAGKSTLLKILSRITEPTRGRVELRGRVGSLLEVGTGFHHELTGAENIYLNGAILGMRRAEIRARFDAIVEFAEIGPFLDTPVKFYSSGMYVRLAFAVAAHMNPDILLVDEVLAVGDAAFQRRCLGKMDDVAKQGRTVLFVSHHMPSVARLCRRGLLIDKGTIRMDDEVSRVTGTYLKSDLGTTAERLWEDWRTAPGDEVARLKAVRVLASGRVSESIDIRQPVTLEMEYWNRKPGAVLLAAFTFINDQGVHLFVTSDWFSGERNDAPKTAGVYRARCTVPGNLFAEGVVRVAAEVSTGHPLLQIHALEHDSVAFQVVDTGEPGSVRAEWGRPIPGVLRPRTSWETTRLSGGEAA